MTFWPKATLTLLPLPQEGQGFCRGGGNRGWQPLFLKCERPRLPFRSFIDRSDNLWGGEQKNTARRYWRRQGLSVISRSTLELCALELKHVPGETGLGAPSWRTRRSIAAGGSVTVSKWLSANFVQLQLLGTVCVLMPTHCGYIVGAQGESREKKEKRQYEKYNEKFNSFD